LAFLVSSFVARNADVWLHLATGRLLAKGVYSFGTDPFSYTTNGVYWANPSWLYDLGLYQLFNAAGGPALVVLKAALIALLAGLLLLIRQPGKSGWAPAFCTALAILVMSPRLLLQPICISIILLGLTLCLLWRCRAAPQPTAWRPRLFGREVDARLLLLPLFALWVNLDEWFLLGPALVGLFWIGDRMRPPGGRPTPGWLFFAGLLTCLCGPHHFHAFALPADLFPAFFYGGLLQDARFHHLSASPWQFDGAFRSSAGANVAGLAYFALVAVGIASFVFNRSALRDWRVLVWGFFALLGAWQVRLIPFFAVVAGPVAALNMQGIKAQPRPAVVFALRTACLAFLLALIALAVPGWLQGFHQKARQVAWDVEADPSLRRAAESLRVWRARGLLRPDERTFPFHPDVACYGAWFCPGEKSYIDSRFSLFGRTGDEYAAVCRELDPSLYTGRTGETMMESIFNRQHVALVVLYDPDPKSLLTVASGLYRNTEEWTLLAVDGQAVIFGWNATRGKAHGDSFADLRFDTRRAAFGASEDDEERAPAAPGQGPGRDPHEPDWKTPFGKPQEIAWESAAASVYLRLFEDKEEGRRRESVDRYYTTAAAAFGGLPANVEASAGPLGPPAAVAFRLGALDERLAEINDKPPELPLLAVRAARRAAAANPDDANAYLRLAQAYLTLRNETVEHSHGASLSPLVMLRHVQIVTALRQALILNPDLEAAHQNLAILLAERQYYDAALDHRRAELRISRGAGRRAGEDADAFTRRLDEMARRVREMEKQVQDAQDKFVIDSQPLRDNPLAKAELALRYGLARQALEDVLLRSRVELFGSLGARLELELLLMLGRAEEARGMLTDGDMKANKRKLTTFIVPRINSADPTPAYIFPAYEWLLTCQAAASGDYDPADAALEEIGERLNAEVGRGRLESQLLMTSEIGALAQRSQFTSPLFLKENLEMQSRRVLLQVEQADVLALRGLLDLERGAPTDGERRLAESLSLSRSAMLAGAGCPSRPLVLAYLKRVRAGRD